MAPSEDDIAQVMGVCNIPRLQAEALLKRNNGQIEQAINQFYENPGGQHHDKWDDTAFSIDRNDFQGAESSTGFAIHSHQNDGEQIPELVPFSTDSAPTRPPSRADNSNAASLSTEAGADDTVSTMNRREREEREDRELQEGLALSLQDREYHSVNDEVPVYGPVKENASQSSTEWQMVPYGANSYNNKLDSGMPRPCDRTRSPHQPAFLHPLADDNRLPALVTILHRIPLIRELLLSKDKLALDYGANPRWWRGDIIYGPAAGQLTHDENVVMELQRLLAFLDRTNRKYGSAGALAKILGQQGTGPLESRLFRAWQHNQEDSHTASSIYTCVVQLIPNADKTATEELATQFAVLELEYPHANAIDRDYTLYDLADYTLWKGSPDSVEANAYIVNLAEMFCFKLKSKPGNRPVEVPLLWFPDRYLQVNSKEALSMRLKQQKLASRCTAIDDQIATITDLTINSKKTVKVKDLLERAIRHTSESIGKRVIPSARINESRQSTSNDFDFDLSTELRRVLGVINLRIQNLVKERKSVISAMQKLSKSMENSPNYKPICRPYSLRGVSLDKNVTYVRCHYPKQFLTASEVRATNVADDLDQWWRFAFNESTHNNRPAEIMKVSEYEVLEALATSAQDPLLVYASETALLEREFVLPPVLETFVKEDNHEFHQEMLGSQGSDDVNMNGTPPLESGPFISPSKRKISQIEDAEMGSRGTPPPQSVGKSVHFANRLDVEESNNEDNASVIYIEDDPPTTIDEDVIMGVEPFPNHLGS